MQTLVTRPTPITPALSDSSAPIGASTTPSIAGNVSQGDFAQGMFAAGTAVVQSMDEEGELADGSGPSVAADALGAGRTGSSLTPSGSASDKPANP